MTVKILKQNSLVPIQISTDFYARLKQVAYYITNSVSEEELSQQIEKIQTDTELSEFGFSYETILILIKEIEKQAELNNLLEDIELPTD